MHRCGAEGGPCTDRCPCYTRSAGGDPQPAAGDKGRAGGCCSACWTAFVVLLHGVRGRRGEQWVGERDRAGNWKLEGAPHLGGRGKSVGRIGVQCPLDNRRESRIGVRAAFEQRHVPPLLGGECHGDRVVTEKWPDARYRFVQEHADRPEIGAHRGGVALGALGCQVAGCAEHDVHRRRLVVVRRRVYGFGNSEVGDLGGAVVGQEHVCRLDVPVEHPSGVGGAGASIWPPMRLASEESSGPRAIRSARDSPTTSSMTMKA